MKTQTQSTQSTQTERAQESYSELKERQSKDINGFPLFFAFSTQQFDDGMAKLGLSPTDTDKIYKLGGTGGFYRKTDAAMLREMFDRHDRELRGALKCEDFACDAINYELSNHEYCITCDPSDALRALGLTGEEVNSNPVLSNALKRAHRKQVEQYGR